MLQLLHENPMMPTHVTRRLNNKKGLHTACNKMCHDGHEGHEVATEYSTYWS